MHALKRPSAPGVCVRSLLLGLTSTASATIPVSAPQYISSSSSPSPSPSSSVFSCQQCRHPQQQQQQRRRFSTTPPAPGILQRLAAKTSQPYIVHQGTKALYEACARPAAYTVPAEQRRAGMVPKTAEGEEIGVPSAECGISTTTATSRTPTPGATAGQWHSVLGLLPTFSTWSQVTMLHMWALATRLRGADAEQARTMVHQVTDHHFFDCERVMDVNHGLGSAALRQRYLKDLFVQWRGVMMSYDEGLARGDAVLAAAVWRNLFRSRDDVDAVSLAAVVAWIRGTVEDLAEREAVDLIMPSVVRGGVGVFGRRLDVEMGVVAALVGEEMESAAGKLK